MPLALAVCALLLPVSMAQAQGITYRGFVEVRGLLYPQDAPNDQVNAIGAVAARAEAFADPLPWLQLAAGLDLRANTHGQVGSTWTPDITDRTLTRPALSVRRLSATLNRGPLTIDAGRQFVRWGRTDIVTPTDRFAPRDYLNVIDADFLAVNGLRTRVSGGFDSLDLVWVPVFTPGRLPLLDQRWAVGGGELVRPVLVEDTRHIPERWQGGVRWERVGAGYEFAVSYSDGFSNMPVLEAAMALLPPSPGGADRPWGGTGEPGVTRPGDHPAVVPVVRRFPGQRMAGGDAALPTRWFTLKGEAGYFRAWDDTIDDYVLYVVQLERQTGEWLLIGGYAGEVVTRRRESSPFAPDRGVARSIVGRASYTIDAVSSVAFEGAARQDAGGVYVKTEYSRARGRHWRLTVSGAVLAGSADDFIGQYRRNSHLTAAARYSF